MAADKPQSGEVLVAIIRDRLDFSVLRDQLWYRIPFESVQRHLQNRWPPDWLAFYQTKVFGSSAYSIRYYGRVADIRIASRAELFPHEPYDTRALRQYYQVFLQSLNELPQPIPSRRLRRVVFISTTWEKLVAAREINDLYDDSPLEDELWRQFKIQGIDAERQERVQVGDRSYFLDFAVHCGTGKLDIETDGDTYHSNPEKAATDNVRNNDLEALGWSVLRFSSAQIQERATDYCVPKVIEAINRMGGISGGDGLSKRIPEKLLDGSYQMDLFSNTERAMSNDFFEPRLEHICDIHVDLEPPQSIGATPVGVRQIVPLKSGRVTGPKLNGEVLGGGGADWATVRSDGAVQLDVRATVKTDDGAMIYSYYGGLIIAEPAVFGRLLSAEDVPLGEYYHYINPMFQTGAEQYKWLNQVVAIGRGRVVGPAVEYRVWALRNP